MPDSGGRQAQHRLCDSASGVNWRPTRFQDELTVIRYACCVCHVVPNTTVVLPCSHTLCEQCLTGCIVQDGGSICPLDADPFCEDECQKLKLPDRKKTNLKAHCWNEADGCEFVGTIDAVLLHFDSECAFHAVQCSRCERRMLRTHIAAHYITGCSRNASSASGTQAHKEAGSSSSCDTNVILDKFATLLRQMNDVSARLQDVSSAISGVEISLQRGMESIEKNICTTLDQRLNAGLEELRVSNPCGDYLSSLQSQINELVEQSRQRDAYQIHEIGRVLTYSQIKVKEDVKVQLQEIVPIIRVLVSELKDDVKTQIGELIHVTRDSEGELKEHVSRVVEARISSRLADQQHSLPGAPDRSIKGRSVRHRARPPPPSAISDAVRAAAEGPEGTTAQPPPVVVRAAAEIPRGTAAPPPPVIAHAVSAAAEVPRGNTPPPPPPAIGRGICAAAALPRRTVPPPPPAVIITHAVGTATEVPKGNAPLLPPAVGDVVRAAAAFPRATMRPPPPVITHAVSTTTEVSRGKTSPTPPVITHAVTTAAEVQRGTRAPTLPVSVGIAAKVPKENTPPPLRNNGRVPP
ncbi:hypothetical protein HPB51_014475 [Rhipicephalus microplus]|uniref:RING-type domain-containing protein n=1 Tax=Rhipicephalus microplus TaxID=6941 RepID=A0A9J6EAD1_RHIMP|nr:uncharacterized protein LOC119163665 [Rhipicephalus microplus]KAH8031263.1 hypothetical protein HPB51_014475 [Rhipicephalus microplus]